MTIYTFKGRCCVVSLIIALAMIVSGTAHAEVTAEQLIAQINERKARMDQFRALLNDPDQHTRLAALDVMLKSSDTALKEIAYGIGFASADDAMRALALKGKFRDLQALPLRFDLPKEASDRQAKTHLGWSGAYRFLLSDFDEITGQFTVVTEESNGAQPGHVSGIGMEFNSVNCRGQFELGDSATLIGELACKSIGTFPASIRLN